MLQEHYAQINANWTRDVWAGTAQTEAEKQWPAVEAKFPKEAEKITWEQYRHYASLVSQLPGHYKQAMGSCTLCQGWDIAQASSISLWIICTSTVMSGLLLGVMLNGN